MILIRIITCAVMSILLLTNSHAEAETDALDGLYIGAAIDKFTSKRSCPIYIDFCGNEKYEHDTFTAIIGYETHPNLSIEFNYGFSSSDNFPIDDYTADAIQPPLRIVTNILEKSDYFYRLLLKPSYTIKNTIKLHGSIGYSAYKFSKTYNYEEFTNSAVQTNFQVIGGDIEVDGISYGFGASYAIENWNFGLQYLIGLNESEDIVRTTTIVSTGGNVTDSFSSKIGEEKIQREHLSLSVQYHF